MSFWSRLRESEVEQTLRARAPQPSDELVRGISRMVASRRPRRSALPKLALVAAVTSLLAASLGVAGALGYARESVHSFTRDVSHFVEPGSHDNHGQQSSSQVVFSSSKHDDHHSGGNGNDGNGGNGGNDGNGNGGPNGGDGHGHNGNGDDGNGDDDHNPFGHQYGHRIPLCFHGYIIHVPIGDIVWWILHGAGPPWQCSNGHHH